MGKALIKIAVVVQVVLVVVHAYAGEYALALIWLMCVMMGLFVLVLMQLTEQLNGHDEVVQRGSGGMYQRFTRHD